MRRGIQNPAFLFGASLILAGGCGGGAGGGTPTQPPLPDFSLTLSVSSLDMTQGNSSAPVMLTVNALNGFSGPVQVMFTGLPQGVISNPVSPFPLNTGQSASLIFGAAANASTGQFSISAQASSGSLSHSQPLSLTIQSPATSNFPRSTFLRNDSVATVDIPPHEPRRRQLVFDSAGSRLFVANPAMNRVEVYSDPVPSLQAAIDAPGASSVDLSADGSTLWVGTSTEQLLAISTTNLQIQSSYSMAGLSPISGAVFNRPEEGLSLASGKLALRLGQSSTAESLLALWDPSTNATTNLTPLAPAVFQNGLGVMARSADRARLIVAANDTSGELVALDANANVIAGPLSLGVGRIAALAANSNGSSLAAIFNANGTQNVVLLNGQLNLVASYAATNATGVVFSRDSLTLYVSEALGNGCVITALSAANLQKLGQVSDLAIQGVATSIEEADNSQLVWGRGNRGIGVIDVTSPVQLSSPAPSLASVPSALPAEGPAAGGTSVTLSGANFSSGALVRFASQTPVTANTSGSSQIQVSSPPSAAAGPINLLAYFSNGWLVGAPDAFSYGPAIQEMFPNAGSPSGGDTVYLIGHGFGADPGAITVKIAGQAATVQKVEALPSFASAFSLDPTYPFPIERITLTTPSGAAGMADVSLATPSGSLMLSKSFQYLAAQHIFAHTGLYKFIVYDQGRQQLYLSATDHVDVFDLNAQIFRPPIEPPPNGPPPSAGLRGMALTPDNSKLVVADFGAQNVYLINPDGPVANGSAVSVGGVAGFLNSGPSRVAATSAQTVFVGLSGEGGASNACNNCLGQMNLAAFPPTFEPAPQPEVTSIAGAPLLQADNAGDSIYLAFANAPGGPFASWSAATPNAFTVSASKDFSTDLATASAGTIFAVRSANTTEIRAADLTLTASPTSAELESIPNRVAVPGIALHPSGALLYEPFLDGPPPAAPPATGIRGGIDIRDSHNGRLRTRLYLPEPFAMLSTDTDGLHGGFLTLDENGQRLFALTTSGLTVIKLSSVPLGIGTLTPASGPSSGGATLTISGSGFKSGTTATLGGKSASVTFKDANTLTLTTPALSSGRQQLVLTNPGGESVSLDAAFLAQ